MKTRDNKMYYSQFGEDKILAKIFKGKSSGLCIEVGANDGVNDSTTMFFEKAGWHCILVEPNPVLCKLIRASRNSTLFEFAASDSSGEVTLLVAEGTERAHGVSAINSVAEAPNTIESYGFTYSKVRVKTKTLDEILSDLRGDQKIDFISVDVEGHELEVLKGFSIERWAPTIILIEDNSNCENNVVCDYLKQFNYFRFKRTGVNDWYAHKNNHELVNLHNRSMYLLSVIKNKIKNKIKKIPGAIKLKRFLSNYFMKSA
ncbi:MAG: FkbM family methyltransferase [Gallionella sp.]|nr:FkbM family methyltransferase [Gallionella sp.]